MKFIKHILDKIDVSPDYVRIVCANSDENKLKLKGYNIGKPSDKACKINFYTSTCFEGCDIFDEEGKIYVVSEGKNPNTLYDISTMFVQIIGRIRNSNYKDQVMHILSNTQCKSDVSYKEYKSILDDEYLDAERKIKKYNSKKRDVRKLLFDRWGKEHFINNFIYVDSDYNYSMDRNLLKKSLFDFRLKTEIYNKSFSLNKAYKESGLKVESLEFINYSDMLAANNKTKGKFEDAVEEYHLIKSNLKFGNRTERTDLFEVKYPYLKKAYSILKIDRIRELKYNPNLIKRELVKVSDRPMIKKIVELAVQKIGYHNPVDLDTAKKTLQEIYDLLDIKRKATASKLEGYFIVKNIPKTIDGKAAKHIELVKEKGTI